MIVDHDARLAEAVEREKLAGATAMIVNDLQRMADEAVSQRSTIEERWMEDLRQFHGIYDDTVANKLNDPDNARSKSFINITRPKTNAWAARLGDMLFPNDERNWGIDPTPVPMLTRAAKDIAAEAEQMEAQAAAAVEANNAQIDEQGQADPALGAAAEKVAMLAKGLRDREKATQREIEIAKKACVLMEREIDDQLTEARYPSQCRAVIDDMCKLGVGILKGPIVKDHGRKIWQAISGEAAANDDGMFELVPDESAAFMYRRVNPWHFFPDPAAETIDDAEYTLERHLPNKKRLRRLAREMGFDEQAVRKLLKEGPNKGTSHSSNPSTSYMANLRSLEGDTGSADIKLLDDRYVVWEFYGALETEQVETLIRAMGRYDDAAAFAKEADPMNPLMVRVFFCDGYLLKIEEDYLLDSGETLYSVGTFEKSESSIMGGVGVPRLMRHEQAMLNAAVRMMLDNAALAVGPQIVIDKEGVEPENGSWKLTPRKIWQRIKVAGRGDDRIPPFETHDIPMNQAMLAAIVEMALKFVDEAVAMPILAQGDQGQHVTQTMGGMSMLFNQANVVFRDAVKNWDDNITAPTIGRAYHFNMQFSKKPEIKGDMKVEARGTSVLLVRETQTAQIMDILNNFSQHPVLGAAIKAYNCMRLLLQAMSINPNDVLLEEEEYLEKMAQMAEAGPASPEEIKAQSSLQIVELENASRERVAEMGLKAAEMRMNGELAKLASNENVSLAQIQAMFKSKELDANVRLGTKQLDNQSKERALAVEVSMERENQRRAEERGLEPTGSGGAISLGAERA